MNERTDGQIENIMLPTDSLAWRRQTKSRITRHSCQKGKEKGKGKCIYIALIFFCSTRKALRHGSHSFTCNYTNACLYLVSVHQMAPPRLRLRTSNYSLSLLLICVARKDERLSRPGWLTFSRPWYSRPTVDLNRDLDRSILRQGLSIWAHNVWDVEKVDYV